jgi:protein-S-isoprenylcysteine O-methyltransferase Ste14
MGKVPGQKWTREKRWEIATKYEPSVFVVLRVVLVVVDVIAVGIYVFLPPWLAWAQILLIPLWVRWVGVGLAIITIPFFIWIGRRLGKHVSGQLELPAPHRLITTGPYSHIRHPLYLTYLVFNFITTLIAANWFFFLVILFGLVSLYPRIQAEERMLLEEFGEAYRRYMQRTGRLIPKIRRTSNRD